MNIPKFVETDPATILAAILTDYETLTGVRPLPAQPEYVLCSTMAYHKSLVMNRINETGKALLVDFAISPVLDYLAASFGIERLAAEGAVCTLQFTLVDGHLTQTIPLGTRVSTSDGTLVFATEDDVVVAQGVNIVNIVARCTTTGEKGNKIAVGSVKTLLDPYAYISSVTNTDITAGGADEESDENLRARVKLATAQFSVAGSISAYEYWTKTANPLISDVKVVTYEDDNSIAPGTVRIVSLLKDGEIPTSGINAEILSVLSAETVRPLTDTVEVVSPTVKLYALHVDVLRTKTADTGALTATIYNALLAYTSELKQHLGLDVVKNKIEAICMVAGVYDVAATIAPATATLTNGNYVVSPAEVAVCSGIEIVVNLTNND